MPFINILKTVLEDYNMWDYDRTFFENWQIDDNIRVFMFACHFGHTDVKFKMDLGEFLKDKGTLPP